MKVKKFNKYQSPTKQEGIQLLKQSIKKLKGLKSYKFIIESYKKQLKELQKQK